MTNLHVFFLPDIVNVYLQNSLIIVKEKMITPALIINNVENMVCVKNFIPDQEVPTLEQDQKSMFFSFFYTEGEKH